MQFVTQDVLLHFHRWNQGHTKTNRGIAYIYLLEASEFHPHIMYVVVRAIGCSSGVNVNYIIKYTPEGWRNVLK